ncbi:hypothetical protein WK11_29130 [Burkholderia ubonensis]|uniref:inovirus-type Gp2 protein n=1 Tax=Burkholderia ubonensis TaxID=101571 RepID=UPI00075B509B|nr:inovirus-type Gp2 protein [Burkholderia ubonensis]KVR14092.1 hypothetical protein WK11_29130 [Burkholderia ubonensis]
MNLEETNVDGKRKTIIHKGYASRHLFNIEKFVQSIETGWRGFVEEVTRYGRVKKIRELYLGKRYYRFVNDWLQRYSDLHRYSARVDAFYDVCKELGLIGERPFAFGQPEDAARSDGIRYMDVFNLMIEQIRVRCQSREFKERERLRLFNSKRNVENVLSLEEAMFSEETGKSRWLVLSLTLRYQSKFRRWITPEIVQQHRDRFFRARRCNKLMSGIKNYVWAIEQGEDTGLHLHVILFYSADHNRDEFIAQQIGEYWVDVVTEGKGDYWNGNADWLKKSYEKKRGVGVGQINWKDDPKRKALRENLAYLAKAEQYLMLKDAENIHAFGTGRVPTKAKAGRPRLAPDAIGAEPFDKADSSTTSIDGAMARVVEQRLFAPE